MFRSELFLSSSFHLFNANKLPPRTHRCNMLTHCVCILSFSLQQALSIWFYSENGNSLLHFVKAFAFWICQYIELYNSFGGWANFEFDSILRKYISLDVYKKFYISLGVLFIENNDRKTINESKTISFCISRCK